MRRMLGIGLALGLAACGGDPSAPPPPVPVASIIVEPGVALVPVGDSATFSAVVGYADGDTVEGARARWTSSDTNVATVNQDGVVRGRRAGTARIVAMVGEDTASAGVTVRLPAVTLEVTRLRDTVVVGAQYRVFVTARDETGAIVADAPLTWSTNDSTILAIDQFGWIHGKSWGVASLTIRTESAVAVIPVQVGLNRIDPSRRWAMVSAGEGYTCALTTDGEGMCWGIQLPGIGRLGTGGSSTDSPQPVLGGHRFGSIDAGHTHTCGIDTDSTAWCWGLNGSGQLGTGTASGAIGSPQRVASDHRWKFIDASGHGQTCAIASDDVPYCWGHNDYYQLGRAPLGNLPEIAPYGAGIPARTVGTADFLTCIVAMSGEGYCSGGIGYGELGDGTQQQRAGPLPLAVAGGHQFRSISTSGTFACALTLAGRAYCWGFGPLGNEDPSAQSAIPVAVTGDQVFTSITTGASHACALTPEGAAYCWGDNNQGRLGSHLSDLHRVPIRVSGPYVWRSLSAGVRHTCGVTVDDDMYCWGLGFNR